MSSRSDIIARAAADPAMARRAFDKADAEESLLDYIRLVWSVLEPGRTMVEGRALRMMCEALEAVEAGHIRKLLINVPPGFMKSMLVDVMFPTWVWGPRNRPDRRFCSWSYGEEITIRDNRKARSIIESDVYQSLWGDRFRIKDDQNQKSYYETEKTGFKYAAGIHGGATGHRGDFDVIDDPHKVKEAESDLRREDANLWFTETFPTRKNDDDCAFVVIMQRVHQRDVSGVAIDGDLGYWHLCLPMEYEPDHPFLWTGFDFPGASDEMRQGDWRTELGELAWEERFSREEVEDLKRQLRAVGGEYAVAGQLQQRPAPRGGGMFREADFQVVDSAPDRARMRVRGWDLAATRKKISPYTAGVKMCIDLQGRTIVEDVVRLQGGPGEVEDLILRTAQRDGPGVIQDVPQDPGQAGKAQVAAFARLLQGYVMKYSPETGTKEDRCRPLAAQSECGNLYLVRGPWNDALISELCVFPNGQFKDQADAASRAYARLTMNKPRTLGVGPLVIQ